MEIYLGGVLVVFLINLVKIIVAAIAASSQKIKNIEKLGLYYNIIEGQCTKQKPSWAKVAFYLFDQLVIAPLLSWVNVFYFSFIFIKARFNRVPLPEKIKEINFKLSSANLPRETVKECFNEIARFYGGEVAEIDDRNPYNNEYDKNRYVISSGDIMHDSNIHLEIDKKNHSFTIIARDPSPTFGEHITTCEYKFDGTELWTRTIERKHKYKDWDTEYEYDIKNGVFLEQEFRDRQESLSSDVQKIIFMVEGIEERILKLRSETNWSNKVNPAIRYFILFRHNDLLDDMEAKRFFQAEHERLLSGFKKLEEKVEYLGCSIGKSEFTKGNEIKVPKDIPEENGAEIGELLTESSLAQCGISYGEFYDNEQLIQDIELYLLRLQQQAQ